MNMNDISDLASSDRKDHSLDLLERGIVTATNTVISLLGMELLSIRQTKVVTTIETWLRCAEFF